MKIRFTKMHGLGNDFMVIDAVNQRFTFTPAHVIQWADRHTGIGFDQLLLIEPSTREGYDFGYRILNADGSEVGQCGNGARAITKFIVERHLSDKRQLRVYTSEGELSLSYHDAHVLRVSMGVPRLCATQIPMIASHERGPFVLTVNNQPIEFDAVNIGNPHIVIDVVDVARAPVTVLAEQLRNDPHFPEGVNIGFKQIHQRDHIALRVYERGAGETQACGSGACAAVVAGIMAGSLDHRVRVTQAGGELVITWAGEGHPVYMEGPAVCVFDGEIELIST